MTRCSNVSGHCPPGNPSVSCIYPAIKNFVDCDIPLTPIKRLIIVSSRDESRGASRISLEEPRRRDRDAILKVLVARIESALSRVQRERDERKRRRKIG